MAGKKISNLEWVARAASQDEGRPPVLAGVHVSGGQMVCTDGKRLHVAPNNAGLPDGVWRVDSGGAIGGEYPGWREVLPTRPHDLVVEELADLLAVCSAAVAFKRAVARYEAWAHNPTEELVSLPAGDGYAHFEPRFLLDALDYGRPARAVFTITMALGGPLEGLRIDLDQERTALVMPVRLFSGHESPAPRFDLSAFLHRVEREQPDQVAEEPIAAEEVA